MSAEDDDKEFDDSWELTWPYMRHVVLSGFIVTVSPTYTFMGLSGKKKRSLYAVMDTGPCFPGTVDKELASRRHYIRLRFTGTKEKSFRIWVQKRIHKAGWPAWVTVQGELERVRRPTLSVVDENSGYREVLHELQVQALRWSEPMKAYQAQRTDGLESQIVL